MRRGTVTDDRLKDLLRLGTRREEALAWLAQMDADDEEPDPTRAGAPPLHIWPENWAVLGLFMSVQTQWRHGPKGVPTGLRYSEVEAVMRLRRLPNRARLFEQLVEMEHAVLEACSDGN